MTNKYNMDRTYCGIIAIQGAAVRERLWKMLREARQTKEQKEATR